jgi:F-type H+-transporting ATPase subunit gamma
MLSLTQLKSQIESTETIKQITEALGDIAALKLQQTRSTVEQNIRFFKEMSDLYRLIKYMAIQKKVHESYKKPKEGQTVCVLLTSNQHFYGGLDLELTGLFIKQTLTLNCDRVVVGSIGKSILTDRGFTQKYEAIGFKQEYPTLEELRELSQKVFQYSKILVFHNKYKTILTSIPSISDISASDVEATVPENFPFYIAEPDVDKMLDFFESQILILLFQAIFLEVDITRAAARMIAMNAAQDHAIELFDQDSKEILRSRKRMIDLEIMQTYAGMNVKSTARR